MHLLNFKINKILIALILIGAFLRLFKLADFPIQLNHDEISQLYDAISVAETGKDIYGNFLPFIFPSVGDFKPPFYTYVTSFFYLIFGWSEFTIRFTSAIFGTLLIPAIYFFVVALLKNRPVALLAAFFTAVTPFEIFFSRKSFENGAGILLMLLGFTFLLTHFEKKNIRWVMVGVVSFSIAMYTYFSHAIIIPPLILAFFLIYREHFLSAKKYFSAILLFIVLTLPLLFLILSNSNVRFRSQTVFIKQDVALGRQLELTSDNSVANNLLQTNTTISYGFNRYLQQFDPVYLFMNGLDLTNQDLLGVGPLLFVQLPFLILGIIFLLRSNLTKQKKFILVWILLGMLPSGLTFEPHSPHRVVMVFSMLNIICAIGLFEFIKWASQSLRGIKFKLIASGIMLFFGLNFAQFLHIYFINFAFEKSQTIQYPFEQIAKYAWEEYPNFDQIIIDPQFGDISPQIGVGMHYYLAFYGNYPPEKFQQQYRVGEKAREIIFDKFSIRGVYWPADRSLKNTLVIVSPWTVPEQDLVGFEVVKKFNFYNGKLAFWAIKL